MTIASPVVMDIEQSAGYNTSATMTPVQEDWPAQ